MTRYLLILRPKIKPMILDVQCKTQDASFRDLVEPAKRSDPTQFENTKARMLDSTLSGRENSRGFPLRPISLPNGSHSSCLRAR